jgi:hypothetical protein
MVRLKPRQNVTLAAYAVALCVWSGNIMLGAGGHWLAGTAVLRTRMAGGVGGGSSNLPPTRLASLVYGVYQTGVVYARSWTTAGTFSGRLILKKAAS